MATSGLDLHVKGLGEGHEGVRLRVRVHTVGHHSKRHLDGPNLSQSESRQILNLLNKVTESVVRQFSLEIGKIDPGFEFLRQNNKLDSKG